VRVGVNVTILDAVAVGKTLPIVGVNTWVDVDVGEIVANTVGTTITVFV
jgi:hypothetical protein